MSKFVKNAQVLSKSFGVITKIAPNKIRKTPAEKALIMPSLGFCEKLCAFILFTIAYSYSIGI